MGVQHQKRALLRLAASGQLGAHILRLGPARLHRIHRIHTGLTGALRTSRQIRGRGLRRLNRRRHPGLGLDRIRPLPVHRIGSRPQMVLRVILRHIAEELVQHIPIRRLLAGHNLRPLQRWINTRIQHRMLHPIREQAGITRPQDRAIRQTININGFPLQRFPHLLPVPGGVLRGDLVRITRLFRFTPGPQCATRVRELVNRVRPRV